MVFESLRMFLVLYLGHDRDVTGEICTKWNERESTWRKSGSCQSRGTSQSNLDREISFPNTDSMSQQQAWASGAGQRAPFLTRLFAREVGVLTSQPLAAQDFARN
jgi:hypothetical protein